MSVSRAVVIPAIIGLAGCAVLSRGPIRTALVDVTGESRTIRVYPGGLNLFPIAEHRQCVSIGGLLNIPDVGQLVNFAGESDVTTAVGIAEVQSYRLIGEAPAPEGGQVTKVREALERVQALALDASILTGEVARLRKDLASKENDSVRKELEERLTKRQTVEKNLYDAKNDLREWANVPGVVIARWDAAGEAGASLDAGATIGGAASERRSGFVILGGLRIVSIVFGEDFWWLLNNLRPHEKHYIDQLGITTNLVQAQEVAYTSDLNVQQSLAIDAYIKKLGGDALESAHLAAYWSFVGQYSNAGNLPRITWKREPFCAVCSVDLPGLANPDERALQKYFGVENKDIDPHTFQGWRTVSATVTYLTNVPLFFNWKDHAAKYAKEREMWSAPSCPFCGSKRKPAVIDSRPPSSEATPKCGPPSDR
ncbi:MAG: hypothetical protein HYR85_08340 [Planctomycetes bacterium]|nr:hypothetical protein [Planctomycetota bacterium]MBI3845301.1 hypothetical protein [Planctomycetota bacterium]